VHRRRLRQYLERHDPAMTWFALVHVATACMLFRFAVVYQDAVGISVWHMADRFLLNVWLLTVLIAAFLVWSLLLRRELMPAWAGSGLLLASFGLACRTWCDLLTFGFGEIAGLTYDGRALLESAPSAWLRFQIGWHQYGGLLAYAVGMTVLALGLRRPPNRRRSSGPGR
jgi:hypothetical protein